MHFLPVVLALLMFPSSATQEKQEPVKPSSKSSTAGEKKEAPPAKKVAKKVWTNDNIPQEGGISTPKAKEDSEQPDESDSATPRKDPYTKPSAISKPAEASDTEKDPDTYSSKITSLRVEIRSLERRIDSLESELINSKSGQAKDTLGRRTLSFGPKNELDSLRGKKRALEQQINEIIAQAARNGVTVR